MNIGIYIYDNAEVLDFSGPFEVFSTAKRLVQTNWNIFFITETGEMINARGGFKVKPDYSINDHPEIDLLLVVGGIHNDEVRKANVIGWPVNTAPNVSRVVSVCTGAFLLAEAGLLDGLKVTTHWEDQDDLAKDYPTLTVVKDQRWVTDGKITTSGGISAGIDMSLHLVSELIDTYAAVNTAKQMEYQWLQNKADHANLSKA